MNVIIYASSVHYMILFGRRKGIIGTSFHTCLPWLKPVRVIFTQHFHTHARTLHAVNNPPEYTNILRILHFYCLTTKCSAIDSRNRRILRTPTSDYVADTKNFYLWLFRFLLNKVRRVQTFQPFHLYFVSPWGGKNLEFEVFRSPQTPLPSFNNYFIFMLQ